MKRVGGGKSFSHAVGGAQQVLGSFYSVALSFSHIEGRKSFHSLKGGEGREKFYPVLSGGAKSFGPAIFPFCSPPPRN